MIDQTENDAVWLAAAEAARQEGFVSEAEIERFIAEVEAME